MNSNHRLGSTLVELLVVIAIVGVLVGMFLPAVQSVREAARRTDCLNRIRQLSVAALNYESSNQRFPPGTLGYVGPIRIPEDMDEDGFWEPGHPFYWKNAQHTSSLARLLPFMELTQLSDALPTQMFSEITYHPWPGDLATVRAAGRTKVPAFYCPSDSLEAAELPLMFVAMNPGFDNLPASPTFGDVLIYAADDGPEGQRLAGTNYVGCIGAHSGARYSNPALRGYEGVMGCRVRVRMSDIGDGASNTIMFGEGLGRIVNGERTGVSSWMFGAVARGRGSPPWGLTYSSETDTYFLGDKIGSHHVGFGSMHPQIVNFSKADGAVFSVNRAITLDIFYGLCGRNDGVVIGDF